jgi:hypothetical protein
MGVVDSVAAKALWNDLLAELFVLFDLVVKIAHALICVAHPELPKTFRTCGAIAEMRIPEAPECMVASLVGAGEWIHEPQLLQRRMKVPANDVRRGKRFPVPGAEQKPCLAPMNEFFQHFRDRRMEIHLSNSARCLEPFFDLALANLLVDADGPKIRGDVLVNFNAKRFPDP